MQNKRLVGVITVLGGWAVQSFGYSKYLPLGRPTTIAENFDRWGADEIFLCCIDRNTAGPDLHLLEEVANLGLTTPLIYAGGIRSREDAIAVVSAGADRIVVESGWLHEPNEIRRICTVVGSQAIIASMPILFSKSGKLRMFDYRNSHARDLPTVIFQAFADGELSELLVIDCKNEGTESIFDVRLLEEFPPVDIKIIAFGGISNPNIAQTLLEHSSITAIGVGNFLNYREHAIQYFKQSLTGSFLRPAHFHPFRRERPFHAPDL